MMTRRNMVMMLVAIVMLFTGFTFIPGETMAATPVFPKMDIKLPHVLPTDSSIHAGTMKFAELMKERTGGAVNVQVFPNSQLGSERDNIEQIRNGMIHMSVVGGSTLANVNGWSPINAFLMPFVLQQQTEEEQNAMLNKLLRMPFMTEAIAKAPEISGIRGLDLNWFYGMRHITTKAKQIQKVADLKGLKIRTIDSPVGRLPMAAMGAAVTPMSFSEVYSALQMGVVDGQENPPSTIYTMKFYEVQKYMALTGHQTQSLGCVISEKFYQSLSPELRAIIEKAALDAGLYQSMLQIRANKDNVSDMEKKGLIVNTVNRKEFAEMTKDAWKQFEPAMGKGLYEKFIAAQK